MHGTDYCLITQDTSPGSQCESVMLRVPFAKCWQHQKMAAAAARTVCKLSTACMIGLVCCHTELHTVESCSTQELQTETHFTR